MPSIYQGLCILAQESMRYHDHSVIQSGQYPCFVPKCDSLSSHWLGLPKREFKLLVITKDNWPPRKGCMGNLNSFC